MAVRSPAISVVLTNFDRLSYLKQSVASVRAQTFRDWEPIVVDGGSSDGSREWLRKQRGLQAALLSGNPGPAALMNEGVGRARGRLVAFLESDDYWLARHLEAMVGAFDD